MEAVEIAGIKISKIYHTANTKMEFKHPKYYAALRAERRKHQVTSHKLPGPRPISNANKGLIHRRQASSVKPQATVDTNNKRQAPSGKHQASSRKRQAAQ